MTALLLTSSVVAPDVELDKEIEAKGFTRAVCQGDLRLRQEAVMEDAVRGDAKIAPQQHQELVFDRADTVGSIHKYVPYLSAIDEIMSTRCLCLRGLSCRFLT